MDVPHPKEGDVNIGTATFAACWVLTAIVGAALLFRYAVKAWIRWALPQVSVPERIWGIEDLFFLAAYGCDIAHMTAIQNSDIRLRASIIICAIVQIVANMVTVVQIVVQCGPNPYRTANRLLYFKYMWTPLPADGSVVCQSPSVQTTVGFVQGGFNTVIDFFLAALAAMELWQFFIRTLHNDPNLSVWSQFRKINRTVRSRRIWQTLFEWPITALRRCLYSEDIRDRQDFTYNIVSFILWVKIENYSILLASCAPVARLFLRAIIDRRHDKKPGYWSRSRSTDNSNKNQEMELKRRPKDQWMDLTVTNWQDEESQQTGWEMPQERSESRISRAEQPNHVDDGCVTVKTDITVQVDDGRSISSGGARLLPEGAEPLHEAQQH
ncbi:hypothetical protein N7470_007330 [Penicillium chermesinum]|nr:hypothetical protein N7470_007330 [Penicillium chermesinum]